MKLVPKISFFGIGLLVHTSAHANMPVPDNMFFCGYSNENNPLTVYESETSQIFDQNLILRNSGTYWVSVEASGFTFEGHIYARRSNLNKWTHIAKTPKGKSQWTRRWRIRHNESNAYLRLQVIKDDNSCYGCTIKVEVNSECSNS